MTDRMPIPVPVTKFAELLPPLSTEELVALEADIEVNGVQVPIVVDEDGRILDGHHRYSIDPECPVRVVAGLTEPEKEAYVIRANLVRRNLSADQKREVSVRQREIANQLRTQDAKLWTQEKVAAVLGVTRQAVSKWWDTNSATGCEAGKERPDSRVKVTPKAKESIAARVANGEPQKQVAADYGVTQQTVSNVVAQAKAAAAREELATQEVELPEDLYDVVVIDPPWPMEKIEREVRPKQAGFDYPTMEEEELEDLEIPAADDCHLWIWTTHKFLPMALRLCDVWGFRYVCTFVWHKPGGFQPVGLPQYNSEFAIYCRRGSPKFKTTKQFPTCFEAKRGRHSEKPKEFYEMIARVTEGKRIDMFSRKKIEGFDAWGNEA